MKAGSRGGRGAACCRHVGRPSRFLKRMAMRVDPSSRTVGVIRDWASQDGLQAAFWADEWYSCAVKRQRGIGVPVMNWSETLPSAALRDARRFGSSRESSQAPVRPDLIKDGLVQLLNPLSEGDRAGVEGDFVGRRGEASSGVSVVACPLDSDPL